MSNAPPTWIATDAQFNCAFDELRQLSYVIHAPVNRRTNRRSIPWLEYRVQKSNCEHILEVTQTADRIETLQSNNDPQLPDKYLEWLLSGELHLTAFFRMSWPWRCRIESDTYRMIGRVLNRNCERKR